MQKSFLDNEPYKSRWQARFGWVAVFCRLLLQPKLRNSTSIIGFLSHKDRMRASVLTQDCFDPQYHQNHSHSSKILKVHFIVLHFFPPRVSLTIFLKMIIKNPRIKNLSKDENNSFKRKELDSSIINCIFSLCIYSVSQSIMQLKFTEYLLCAQCLEKCWGCRDQ